jgi:hypothetical protein
MLIETKKVAAKNWGGGGGAQNSAFLQALLQCSTLPLDGNKVVLCDHSLSLLKYFQEASLNKSQRKS